MPCSDAPRRPTPAASVASVPTRRMPSVKRRDVRTRSKKPPEPPQREPAPQHQQDRGAPGEARRDLALLLLHRDLRAELLIDGAQLGGLRSGRGGPAGT